MTILYILISNLKCTNIMMNMMVMSCARTNIFNVVTAFAPLLVLYGTSKPRLNGFQTRRNDYEMPAL